MNVIFGVPAPTPVTIGDPTLTVANDALLLLQVPVEASLNVIVELTQTLPVLVIASGSGLTVKLAETEQPGVL